MSNFISDDEMEKLSPSKSDFISDDEMENHERNQKISPLVSGIRKGIQGISSGFLDEASGGVEALGRMAGIKGLGGSFEDQGVDHDGPTLDFEQLKKAYYEGRDRKRKYLAQDSIDNPTASAVAELGGAIASPVNKILPNASLLKSGAAIGAITGFGNSEADDAGGMFKDTAMGGSIGGVLGKAGDMASPYLAKGAAAVGSKLNSAKQAAGKSLSEMAEELAFKATGARLKDFRTANSRGELNKLGRYMLDNGMVKAFDTVDDVGAKAFANKKAAGSALDDIYSQAELLFKDKLNKVGFDPLRDKADILQAAKKELGDSVGAEAALNKLSKYLDEVAARHGDAPMDAALSKYQSEMNAYKPKQEQFAKDHSEYASQLGKAGEDLSQPSLPGVYDDFQRTGFGKRQVETYGQDASRMVPENYEYGTQMDLLAMPTGNSEAARMFSRPGEANFGHAGGDTASRLGQRTVDALEAPAQQDFLAQNFDRMISNNSHQGAIEGTSLVPRSFQNVDETLINQGRGQMQFPIAPEAPAIPMRPGDIRNPMSPRRTNDVKGAFDNEINYARNPLSKDPATEKAFYGARSRMAEKVEQGLDDLGGGEIVDNLRKANKEYSYSTRIAQQAQDRAERETANKMFGLTDTIAAGAATTYGVATGDWKSSVAMLAAKKGIEKYGVTTLSVMADKIGKKLMQSPQMAQLATSNPKAFGAMVYSLVERMEGSGSMALPRAADSKNQETAAIDKDSIMNKFQGTKYHQVLQNAAQKGDQSFNAAAYVLQQRDPDFRKQLNGENKQEHNHARNSHIITR